MSFVAQFEKYRPYTLKINFLHMLPVSNFANFEKAKFKTNLNAKKQSSFFAKSSTWHGSNCHRKTHLFPKASRKYACPVKLRTKFRNLSIPDRDSWKQKSLMAQRQNKLKVFGVSAMIWKNLALNVPILHKWKKHITVCEKSLQDRWL